MLVWWCFSELVILLPFGQSRTTFILNDQGMVCGGELAFQFFEDDAID